MALSFMTGKGLSTTQLLNLVLNSLYNQFVEKDIMEFDGFNVGILDTFNTINMALPGKHYVAPSYQDVKDLFEQWKATNKEDKRKKFSDFINEKVNLNKADESMLITAIVAPSAAMMAKKTGQVVPQLALMNAIPDVLFVPSATLLALVAIKIIRLTFIGKTTSKVTDRSHVQPTPKLQLPTTIEEPQMLTEQKPQIKNTIEEAQITTEQKPQTETTIEEPQVPTEQKPLTETTVEEPQMLTEQNPQTETTIEEPQLPTEQKPQTKTTIEEPQIPFEQEHETTPSTDIYEEPLDLPRHIHKDGMTCRLCEEMIAKAKMERSNAMALKT